MPTLILARHAHASHAAGTDFDRPLTDAGQAEARRTAQFLEPLGVDYAVASAALRTQQTGEAVVALRSGLTLRADRSLYRAPVDAWLEVISTIPARAQCAYIVGHQPTVADTVLTLAPTTPLTGFRPSSVAVFDLPSWNVPVGEYPVPRIVDFV